MDLKGAGDAMTQRAQQSALKDMQKQQENQEQAQALKTFKAALDGFKGL